MKVRFLLACCFVSLQSLLHPEPVTSLEVVTPRVQLIKFWAGNKYIVIPIYGNVVVGEIYDPEVKIPISDNCLPGSQEYIGRLEDAMRGTERSPEIEKRKNELLAKVAAEKDSRPVYGADFVSTLWHDLYNLDPHQGLNVPHSPDGKGVINWIDEFKDHINTIQKTLEVVWHDLYNLEPSQGLNVPRSPDGKGVIAWIDEFKHHINAIQKTLEAMPADLQVLIYQQILKQISDNLPNDTVFTRALETKIDADFQGKIDQLQAEIDILKSKIH